MYRTTTILALVAICPLIATQHTFSFTRNSDFSKEFVTSHGLTLDENKSEDGPKYSPLTRAVKITGDLPSPFARNKRQQATRDPQTKAATHVIPIGGEPDDLPALFWIEAMIGTPAHSYRLNLDTGSSTLAIPSIDCVNCRHHEHKPFDYTKSTTFSAERCTSTKCCPNPSECSTHPEQYCAPLNPDLCGFEIAYGDDSGVSGYWVQDKVTLAGYEVDLHFGLFTELRKNKPFEPFKVDGIIGVADRSINYDRSTKTFDTVMDAIHKQRNLPEIFSICFGMKGGSMTVGGVDTCHMTQEPQYTPADISEGFWGAHVTYIHVGQSAVTLSADVKKHAIIDSGTTLWIVDDDTFGQLVSFMASECEGKGCSEIVHALTNQQCVHKSVIAQLPAITVKFDQTSVPVVIPASVYLIPECEDPNYLGLGIVGGGEMNIWGDVFMRPYTWVFDRDSERIGFAPMEACDRLPNEPLECAKNQDPINASKFADFSESAGVVGAACVGVLILGGATVTLRRRRRMAGKPGLSSELLGAQSVQS